MMRLTERRVGNVTVMDVAGTIIGDEGDAFRNAVARILELGHREIVLDLSELTYIDSTALGNLVASQIRAGRAGTTLKLANAQRRLHDLLVLTRLQSVFESFESLPAALASFNAR